MSKVLITTIADLGKLSNLKSNQSEAIIRAFRKKGHSVKVLCRDYSHYKASRILPLGATVPKILSFIEEKIPFPGRKITNYLIDLCSSLRVKKEYSLVVTIPSQFPKTLRKAKKLGITTLIYEGVAHPKTSYEIMRKEDPDYILNEQALETLRYVDYVLTLSEFAKESYIKNGFDPDKVLCAPTGVDSDKYKPGKKDDKFRVLAVGNYDLRKGFHYLLQAWDEMKLPDSELVILGNPLGKMKEIVAKYEKKLSDFKAVRYKDALSYYQNASIYVLPSLLEGSSKTIYEAMACGLPVLCTYESGSIARDKKDGFIIPSRNVKAIKEKILYLHKNPSKRFIMGRNARERVVDNYQWKHFSTRIFTELEKIK